MVAAFKPAFGPLTKSSGQNSLWNLRTMTAEIESNFLRLPIPCSAKCSKIDKAVACSVRDLHAIQFGYVRKS